MLGGRTHHRHSSITPILHLSVTMHTFVSGRLWQKQPVHLLQTKILRCIPMVHLETFREKVTFRAGQSVHGRECNLFARQHRTTFYRQENLPSYFRRVKIQHHRQFSPLWERMKLHQTNEILSAREEEVERNIQKEQKTHLGGNSVTSITPPKQPPTIRW